MPERKPAGACLMKQESKDFKEKNCVLCGRTFKPNYPNSRYCSSECRDRVYKSTMKAAYPRKLEKIRRKAREYNMTHHFCPICGKPIPDGRQHVHFECVLGLWRSGDRPRWVKRYFENRGYRMKEVDELADEERSV